jgi:formylmethanofuran dehydrogenase subunit C
MALCLVWRDATRLSVELDGLTPSACAAMSVGEIAHTPVFVGNGKVSLGELFQIKGDASDGVLRFEGTRQNLARLGEGMESGRIEVFGDVGAHLGAGMKAGLITVEGSAGAWAGAEMRGGRIQIRGDAGDQLGAAYAGSRLGMREGVILVTGNAGDDAGLAMRRGFIAVGGRLGGTPGRAMVAGSIFGFGVVGSGVGSGMKRGTIALLASEDNHDAILPTFVRSGLDRPPFLAVYLRQLAAWNFPVPVQPFSKPCWRYNGDHASGGQGEIWIAGPT